MQSEQKAPSRWTKSRVVYTHIFIHRNTVDKK